MSNALYEKLLGWLNKLVDAEFKNMISSLLPPELQGVLTDALRNYDLSHGAYHL